MAITVRMGGPGTRPGIREPGHSGKAPAPAGRSRGIAFVVSYADPFAARHLSFTTARRTLITTVRAGTATASLPAPARAAAHHTTLAVIATARVITDRHRHRDHKIKSRQPFSCAPRGITTRTAPAHLHVCGTTA